MIHSHKPVGTSSVKRIETTSQRLPKQPQSRNLDKATQIRRGRGFELAHFQQQRTQPHYSPARATSLERLQEGKNDQVDRFIPNRRMLRPDYLSVQQLPNPEDHRMPASQNLLSHLYRRYVMDECESIPQNPQSIQSFQNSNLLRFCESGTGSQNVEQPADRRLGLEIGQKLTAFKSGRRKVSKLPVKVLDAPALQDDFYLNLIDWSPDNCLVVGLATSVYLWNASNAKVTKLCDLGIENIATSVACSVKEPLISLGTQNGDVQIWDIEKVKLTRTLTGHSLRVGSMSWSTSLLSTGSRDKKIIQRDLRIKDANVQQLNGHKQQICGLKWSIDEQQLCSGGNDNKLLIWNPHFTEPILRFTDHIAAVKAMAWSPHQHGLLLSGGGTADRTIKARNTLTGATLSSHDVGSQICNLTFSRTLNEFVSTHGYSLNQINVWKYPQMQRVATLTGHSYRVLYLAMSPDGSTIVTGAGDETLRFWNIFPSKSQVSLEKSKVLHLDSIMLR